MTRIHTSVEVTSVLYFRSLANSKNLHEFWVLWQGARGKLTATPLTLFKQIKLEAFVETQPTRYIKLLSLVINLPNSFVYTRNLVDLKMSNLLALVIYSYRDNLQDLDRLITKLESNIKGWTRWL